jgi:hypothetical protein
MHPPQWELLGEEHVRLVLQPGTGLHTGRDKYWVGGREGDRREATRGKPHAKEIRGGERGKAGNAGKAGKAGNGNGGNGGKGGKGVREQMPRTDKGELSEGIPE